jgi:hypothetical protein
LRFSQFSRRGIIALAGAALFAQTAAAGGEPKNEVPFTRPVVQTTPQSPSRLQVEPAIQGEPKNESPFAQTSGVVIVSRSGFDWTDGGIGAAAGFGIALSGVGLIALAHKSPRTA